MADPATIGAVSMAASAGGSILGAVGEKKKAAATSQMYTYQAGIADLNRRIALGNRDYAITAGGEEAKRFGMKSAQVAGAIKAKQGASGVDVTSGSSVDVQKSQKQVSDLDMATIRNNAARKAYGYQLEAETATMQGQMYTAAASNSLEAGNIAAAGSLISGVSSVSSKWLQGKQAGLWDTA
jgi:hypothetical protein